MMIFFFWLLNFERSNKMKQEFNMASDFLLNFVFKLAHM